MILKRTIFSTLDYFYCDWMHPWLKTKKYSPFDIKWNPDIKFRNIKVIDSKNKLLFTITISNLEDENYWVIFYPSKKYCYEKHNILYTDCKKYVKNKYNKTLKFSNNDIQLKIGENIFCYYIKDDKDKIVYYSDDRNLLIDKMNIRKDYLYVSSKKFNFSW